MIMKIYKENYELSVKKLNNQLSKSAKKLELNRQQNGFGAQ